MPFNYVANVTMRKAGFIRTRLNKLINRMFATGGTQQRVAREEIGPDIEELIDNIQKEGLSYLELEALNDIYESVKIFEDQSMPGAFIEAGCALGGSGIVIAAAKKNDRPLFIYDVFEMIPAPSNDDAEDAHKRYDEIASGKSEGLKGNVYYGYENDLLGLVKDNFTRYGCPPKRCAVHFVEGLFEHTMHIDIPVAFAHIDCDWYNSVKICMQRIAPNVIVNGRIIIDDYLYYKGCRKAVDEYLAEHPGMFKKEIRSRLHLVRVG